MYFLFIPVSFPLCFRHIYALIRSHYMPFVYVLITNRPLGTMPKRSELKFTKRAVDALDIEGKGVATIVVIGIGSVVA